MKIFSTKINNDDVESINTVIISGDLGFGPNVTLFENEFAYYSQRRHNVSTSSASASAFIVFSYMKELYGICDVYTTSLGFTSPAWAAKHFGHNLIFVDVEDLEKLYIINHKSKKRELVNIIRSTNTQKFKPYITIHGYKFILDN